MKILICDQDNTNLAIIEKNFLELGHKSISALDGIDAVEKFSSEQPDLVLISGNLLHINGFETIKKIKENCYDFADWIPVVFMSENLDDDTIIKAIESGADFVLPKRMSIQLLKATIKAMRRLVSYRQNLIDFGHQLREVNDKLLLSNQLLSELSLKDPLTLLANRRAFEESLERICRQAIQNKKPVSLLMIDVDHFKNYNDTYGHQAGDVCLQKIASIFKSPIQGSKNIIARYGGEEFAIILPETEQAEAAAIAEKIREAVELLEIKNIGTLRGFVTLSIGVSISSPDIPFTSESLVSAGDEALYHAKEQGRNIVVVSDRQVNMTRSFHTGKYKLLRKVPNEVELPDSLNDIL